VRRGDIEMEAVGVAAKPQRQMIHPIGQLTAA